MLTEINLKKFSNTYKEFIMRKVDQVTDKLGMPIDEGIKKAVETFWVIGFKTCMSCAGHPDEEGFHFPWIDFDTPPPEGWKESIEKKKSWARKNIKQQEEMISLLGDFYKNRPISSWGITLTVVPRGIFGAFQLHSTDVGILFILTEEERQKKYSLYKKEMDDFVDFLKIS